MVWEAYTRPSRKGSMLGACVLLSIPVQGHVKKERELTQFRDAWLEVPNRFKG